MSDGVRVGILSLHNSKETKAICNAVAALGHEPLWLRAENLTIEASGRGARVEPEPDVVVNRALLPSSTEPLTTLGLVASIEATGVPVLNPTAAVAVAVHKFAAAARLANAGVPVPAARLGIGAHRIERLGLPGHSPSGVPTETGTAADSETTADSGTATDSETTADSGTATDGATADGSDTDATDDERDSTDGPGRRVFKRPIGTHGDETELLDAGEYAPQVAGETQGIVQEMVDTPTGDHEDVRIYVVDGEPLGAMRRYAPGGDWRTNVARGGRVRDATETLPEETLSMAVEATELLGLDYAGVDVIEGVDGWYVLEVNTTAGFRGFFDATGVSPAPAIAAQAIRRADGTVDPERVAELSTTLDDSVPACRPPLQQSPRPDRSILGYTTEVRVAGTTGAATVTAKADTGATRTSLDLGLAGEIGAGPILDSASVKGDGGGSRPVVPVDVRIGEYTHAVHANVRDRSHLEHDLLLGRDVLAEYSVRVARGHDAPDPEE